jgi:hypothetical protein
MSEKNSEGSVSQLLTADKTLYTDLALFPLSRCGLYMDPQRTPLPTVHLLLCDVDIRADCIEKTVPGDTPIVYVVCHCYVTIVILPGNFPRLSANMSQYFTTLQAAVSHLKYCRPGHSQV